MAVSWSRKWSSIWEVIPFPSRPPVRINRGCPWAKLKKLCIKGALLYPFVDCSKIIVQLSCSNFPITVFIFSNYDIFIYSTPIADLYSLSYLWISGLSFGAAIVVGLIASFALGNYTWLIIHFWFVQRQFTLLCDGCYGVGCIDSSWSQSAGLL